MVDFSRSRINLIQRPLIPKTLGCVSPNCHSYLMFHRLTGIFSPIMSEHCQQVDPLSGISWNGLMVLVMRCNSWSES